MASLNIFYGIFLILLLQNVVDTNWVNDLVEYIVKDSGYYQVYLVTNSGPKDELESQTIQDFFSQLTKRILTLRINVVDDEEHIFTNSNHQHPINTGSTFFVLISKSNGSIKKSEQLIESAAKIAALHYHPKYLFLSLVSRWNDTLEELLEFAWSKKLLDFTVVEFNEKLTKTKKVDNSPMVHQLNPFKKEYKIKKWSSTNTDLFPNKQSDMHGYALRAAPCVGIADFTKYVTSKMHGKIGKVIADRLNATLQYVPVTSEYLMRAGHLHIGPYSVIHVYMEEARLDLWLKFAYQEVSDPNVTLRTITLTMDEICTIVPKKTKDHVLFNQNVLAMYGFYFCLVIAFWILKRMIGLDDSLWSIWNVCCILLGISVTRQPHRYLQRILFISLVVISVVYSSTVYDALTTITVHATTEEKYQSIEDLANSKLNVVMIHPYHDDIVFSGSPVLENFKDRIDVQFSDIKCTIAAINGDICVTRLSAIKMYYDQLRNCHKTKLQYGRPCFRTSISGFIVSKGSPYRSTFDKLLLRMQETGIMNLITDTSPNLKSINTLLLNEHELPNLDDVQCSDRKTGNVSHLTQQLLIFLALGYGISIFVFLIEISPTLYQKYWTPRKWISSTRNTIRNRILKLCKRRKKNEKIKKIIRRRKILESNKADLDELSEIRVLPFGDRHETIDCCTPTEVVSRAR